MCLIYILHGPPNPTMHLGETRHFLRVWVGYIERARARMSGEPPFSNEGSALPTQEECERA